jgi:hypothetical protein
MASSAVPPTPPIIAAAYPPTQQAIRNSIHGKLTVPAPNPEGGRRLRHRKRSAVPDRASSCLARKVPK